MIPSINTLTLGMILTSHDLQLPGRITIEEVAQTAGVAISTVSRALAGKKGVGEATRARIVETAAELGYRTSSAARALRTSRTHTLAYLAADLGSPNADRHLHSAINAAAEHGYSVIVIDVQGAAGSYLADKWQRHDANFDGLILGIGRFDVRQDLLGILHANMPMEPIFSLDDPEADTDGLVIPAYFDRRTLEIPAITLAVRRLISLGHQRITFITLNRYPAHIGARIQAIRDFVKEMGLDENTFSHYGVDQPAHAIGQIQQLMAPPAPSTAIISPGGGITHYILRGIASVQARIPEDVSFLVFDDSPWHRSFFPPLSVVRFDVKRVAINQVERLVARIEGKPIPEIVSTPSEFIERGSFAPAP